MQLKKMTLFDYKNQKMAAMLSLSILLIFSLTSCGGKDVAKTETIEETKISETYTLSETYIDPNNWAFFGDEFVETTFVDCFFIAPTVYSTNEGVYNLSLDNETVKTNFLGASNMERGIYDATCKMYAPYYAQVALEVYEMDIADREEYLEIAYADVREAFLYYMNEENDDRPFVLAGFSQGADMAMRLLKEFFDDASYQEKLVACYAIGWGITQEEVEEYPHLNMAQTDDDIGVIVTFNTEMEGVTTSLMVPETTLAINPLNWTTTSEYASASYNLGACFTDYDGEITNEIPNLTGAYLDENRRTLIVDNTISPEDFPPGLTIFESGVYHLYDYMFFFRNLQENVQVRTTSFLVQSGAILETIETEVEEVVETEEADATNYPEPIVHIEGVLDRVACEISMSDIGEGVPPLVQIVIYDPVIDEPKFDGLLELTENEIHLSSDVEYEFYGNASFGYAIEFSATVLPLEVVVSFVVASD